MTEQEKEISVSEQTARDLATFAIDRTDLKELLAAVPQENEMQLTTLEYELQILKILSVGWGISFYMPQTDPGKAEVTEIFWQMIREICKNISMLTETTTGKQLDYFEILKGRLNEYVKMMQDSSDREDNPANIMGPAFARMCKTPDDAVAILTGTKMFTLTLGSVKEYLETVKLKDPRIN